MPLIYTATKTLIWSLVIIWLRDLALRKEDIRRMETIEMWLRRRMGRVSWTERKSNEEVLKIVGEDRKLV